MSFYKINRNNQDHRAPNPIPQNKVPEVVVMARPRLGDILEQIESILYTQLTHLQHKSQTEGLLALNDLKSFRLLISSLKDLSSEAREERKQSLLQGLTDEEIVELAQSALKRLNKG